VVKSHLNEALLQQIAGAAGGFYLPMRGANAIDTLYERGLAPLPKSEGRERLVRRYHEQYHWPLALAMLLLLAELFLPERKWERNNANNIRPRPSPLPRERENHSPVSAVTGTVVLLALLVLPAIASASPASALREYKTGYYTNAMQEFERLAQANTNDLRLVFNAGASAYRATNFDTALNAFQAATLSPDLKLQQQAHYNLGNTLYRLGELKFEPDTEGLTALEESWQRAIKSYEHAAALNTNDTDIAYNLAFVKTQLGLIAQLREAMRRAKQAADEAVRRNEYHRAVEIMESLNSPIAAKKFQDYIKKLKDIDAIVTPHQP
jgi:Ca-activated chloride channel family protein